MPNRSYSSNNLDTFRSLSARYKQYYTYLEPIISRPIVKSYLSVAASLLLISFLILFALSPTINVVLGLQKQISDQRTTITTLDTKIAALVKAQDSYDRAEPYIPLLNKALPENPDPQTVVEDIRKIASMSGVKIVDFQIQATPLSKDLPLKNAPIGIPALQVSLSVSGSADRIRQFLGDAEKQLRYIRVDNIALVPNNKTSNTTASVLNMGYFYH